MTACRNARCGKLQNNLAIVFAARSLCQYYYHITFCNIFEIIYLRISYGELLNQHDRERFLSFSLHEAARQLAHNRKLAKM